MGLTSKLCHSKTSAFDFWPVGAGAVVGTVLGHIYDNAPAGFITGILFGLLVSWFQMKITQKICSSLEQKNAGLRSKK